MNGTKVGKAMQKTARLSSWKTPCWSPEDESASGVTAGEGQLLYGLVRALRPEVVLEVGTSYGHGTLHLADGLRDNGAGHLHTVEVHAGRQAAAKENVAEAGLSDWVTFYRPDIPALMVDLAFLDAIHTAEAVGQYLDAFSLRPGGVVVVHDASYTGHAEAVARERGYNAVHLPTDSMCGTAIYTWGAA